VSHVLLNYRCSGGAAAAGADLASASAAYMSTNPSAHHVCSHLCLLMYYCMCGEDADAGAVGAELAPHVGALAPLPPPVISKSQYLTGLSKFFESIVEPADGQHSTSSLFYDVMLDAPHAPMLFHQLLLLSTPTHGGAALLPDSSKFDSLVDSLSVYYKK
jgi:hypothetical protein